MLRIVLKRLVQLECILGKLGIQVGNESSVGHTFLCAQLSCLLARKAWTCFTREAIAPNIVKKGRPPPCPGSPHEVPPSYLL